MYKHLNNAEFVDLQKGFDNLLKAKKTLRDPKYKKFQDLELSLDETIKIRNEIVSSNMEYLYNIDVIMPQYLISNELVSVKYYNKVAKYFVDNKQRLDEDYEPELDENIDKNFKKLFKEMIKNTKYKIHVSNFRALSPDVIIRGELKRIFGYVQRDIEEFLGEPPKKHKEDDCEDEEDYYYSYFDTNATIMTFENIKFKKEVVDKLNKILNSYGCSVRSECYVTDNNTTIVIADLYLSIGVEIYVLHEIILELRRILDESQRNSVRKRRKKNQRLQAV